MQDTCYRADGTLGLTFKLIYTDVKVSKTASCFCLWLNTIFSVMAFHITAKTGNLAKVFLFFIGRRFYITRYSGGPCFTTFLLFFMGLLFFIFFGLLGTGLGLL